MVEGYTGNSETPLGWNFPLMAKSCLPWLVAWLLQQGLVFMQALKMTKLRTSDPLQWDCAVRTFKNSFLYGLLRAAEAWCSLAWLAFWNTESLVQWGNQQFGIVHPKEVACMWLLVYITIPFNVSISSLWNLHLMPFTTECKEYKGFRKVITVLNVKSKSQGCILHQCHVCLCVCIHVDISVPLSANCSIFSLRNVSREKTLLTFAHISKHF